MTPRRFSQLDVFSTEPGFGNPLAVVHDAEGLNAEDMATFARWTNLSETTFLLPPTDPRADYRVRIWTPGGELPFAGHPTLGSAHAWLEAGGRPRATGTVVQECGIGLVDVRRPIDGDSTLAFSAPPLLREGAPDPALLEAVVEALGIDADAVVDASWVDNGAGALGVLLRDADTVLALHPDLAAIAALDVEVGVAGRRSPEAPGGDGTSLEVRGFFPAVGIPEDPVTGSLNAGLARWLIGAEYLPADYVAAQGTALGRRGRVHVSTTEDGMIWIGGATTTVIAGTVVL